MAKINSDIILKTLKAEEATLRQMGVESASLFGSYARGEADMLSDIDIAVTLKDGVGLDFVGIKHHLVDVFGLPVDLLVEPVKKPYLRKEIEKDRRRAF